MRSWPKEGCASPSRVKSSRSSSIWVLCRVIMTLGVPLLAPLHDDGAPRSCCACAWRRGARGHRPGWRAGRAEDGRASLSLRDRAPLPQEAPPAWIRVASPRPTAAGGSPPRPGTSRGLRAPDPASGGHKGGKVVPVSLSAGGRRPKPSRFLPSAGHCGTIGT